MLRSSNPGYIEHRKNSNRISAARSREKRAKYVMQLEVRNTFLERELLKVKSDLKRMQERMITFDEREKFVGIIRSIKCGIDAQLEELIKSGINTNTKSEFIGEQLLDWGNECEIPPPFTDIEEIISESVCSSINEIN